MITQLKYMVLIDEGYGDDELKVFTRKDIRPIKHLNDAEIRLFSTKQNALDRLQTIYPNIDLSKVRIERAKIFIKYGNI